mgnify:CR=1 FL=1
MQFKLLLPHKFKKAGWLILLPATLLAIIQVFTGFEGIQLEAKTFALYYSDFFAEDQFFALIQTNIANTLIGILFIIGAMLVGFSREKNEDEFIASLRLSSLLWAVLANYSLLLLAFAFIYGTAFLNVMLYNMFTVLIIFIVRFNYVLYKNAKSVTDEK